MLYFAYDSNMDWTQMQERCPSAHFIGVAELKDHELAFTRASQGCGDGVANAIQSAGDSMWGVIYQIDETDIARLDQCEGYRPGRSGKDNAYTREERHVNLDGDANKPVLASIYFVTEKEGPFLPRAAYKQLIVDGAQFWHLPEAEYVRKLVRIEVSE